MRKNNSSSKCANKKYLTTEQNIQVMLNDYKHQKSEIVSDTSKFPLVSFA